MEQQNKLSYLDVLLVALFSLTGACVSNVLRLGSLDRSSARTNDMKLREIIEAFFAATCAGC
jgi:hypothetical protein